MMTIRTTLSASCLGLVLCGGASAQEVEQEPEPGMPVVLRLRELGMDIRRQKRVIAGGIAVDNTTADGRSLSDEEVRRLIRADARRFRARAGALERHFFEIVAHAAASDAERVFEVAVLSRLDPRLLPPRPMPDDNRRLSDGERDRGKRERLREIGKHVRQANLAAAFAMRQHGARAVRRSATGPFVYASMNAAGILALARERWAVGRIYDGHAAGELELSTSTCSIGAPTVTGAGINPGALEAAVVEFDQVDHPLACLDFIDELGDSSIGNHPTEVAGIVGNTLAGMSGVAPGINILSGDMDQSIAEVGNIEDALVWAINNGADVVNMSYGTDDSGLVEMEDVLLDWYVRHHGTVIFKSAGNISNTCSDFPEVTSPGLGFNVAAVGNYDDNGTCGNADDTISADSCWGDPESPHGDREKPDFAAPGTNITTITSSVTTTCFNKTGSGSSYAAPHASGAAALLMARDGGLDSAPELVRAILMATAFNNVSGDRRLSERDGVGGINVAAADTLLAEGRFHSALLTNDDLQGGTLYEVGLIQVRPQTLRMKVAIAWNGDPSEVLNPDYTLSNDMDLVVEKSTGEVIATSDSFDNSFETVDVLNPDPGFYVFKIHIAGTLNLPFLQASEMLGVGWGLAEHPCVDSGFDFDNDNVCGDVDNCPDVGNADQSDGDGDDDGDLCDNCPIDSNPDQADLDWDGDGDACDDDRDGDGCDDDVDQHPDDDEARIGRWISATCEPGSGDAFGYEGVDTDGDGLLDCEELDDDHDGLDDDDDPCPLIPNAPIEDCTKVVDCGLQVWWEVCITGGCNELLVRLVSVINPDPITDLAPRIAIVGQVLYAFPPTGVSVEQLAQMLVRAAPARLEIWSRGSAGAPASLRAVVSGYSTVRVGDVSRGTALAISVVGDGIAVEGAFAPAMSAFAAAEQQN